MADDTTTAPEMRPLPQHYEHCFGCGAKHPTGLHLAVEGAGDRVRGSFTVSEHHQGAPGLAHGGVLAAAMDEGMGFVLWLIGQPAVTAHLEVDYRRPVPVGTELVLEGGVDKREGRKIFASMTACIGDTVVVEARAIFVIVGVEHFLPHAKRIGQRVERPYNP